MGQSLTRRNLYECPLSTQSGHSAYAFLKFFERTGDQLWLDRAREFAMHAIEQWRAAKRDYGMIRYSLWTGDLGLAAFLCDCIDGTARFPTIDVF